MPQKLLEALQGKRICFFDLETESNVDLTAAGTGRYFTDPSTRILLSVWCGRKGDEVHADDDPTAATLRRELGRADVLVAHNATFDLAGVRAPIDTSDQLLLCTRAMCSALNLPAGLGDAAALLNTNYQKLQMPDELKSGNKHYQQNMFIEAPADKKEAVIEYAKRDVLCLHELFFELAGRISLAEAQAIDAHLRINLRGLPFDHARLQAETAKAVKHQARLVKEFTDLTGFAPTMVHALKHWLADQGVEAKSTARKALEELLPTLDGKAKRAVELRVAAGKATAKKLEKIRGRLCHGVHHGRSYLQDAFIYAGAVTGRWSSKGVNMHNNERGGVIKELIAAPRGERLYVADFAQIELRLALWITRELDALKALHTTDDFYKVTAAQVYNKPIEAVTKGERFFGKCLVLGCNYGMGPAKFMQFVEGAGGEIDEGDAMEMVHAYRTATPGLVRAWEYLGDATRRAMRQGFSKQKGGPVAGVEIWLNPSAKALVIKLPTGRHIYYHDAQMDDGTISYYDAIKRCRNELRHGGLILENICQAVSRDLLARAIVRLEKHYSGEHFGVVGHVHDEVIALVPADADKAELDDLVVPPVYRNEGHNGLLLDIDSHIVQRWAQAK